MKNDILALGFDIGGTKIAAALGTGDGRIISSERIKSENRAPGDVLGEMVLAGNGMLKSNGFKSSDLAAIGIGAPGPMDIPKGTISPCNMKKWVNVPVRDYLSEKWGSKPISTMTLMQGFSQSGFSEPEKDAGISSISP